MDYTGPYIFQQILQADCMLFKIIFVECTELKTVHIQLLKIKPPVRDERRHQLMSTLHLLTRRQNAACQQIK